MKSWSSLIPTTSSWINWIVGWKDGTVWSSYCHFLFLPWKFWQWFIKTLCILFAILPSSSLSLTRIPSASCVFVEISDIKELGFSKATGCHTICNKINKMQTYRRIESSPASEEDQLCSLVHSRTGLRQLQPHGNPREMFHHPIALILTHCCSSVCLNWPAYFIFWNSPDARI